MNNIKSLSDEIIYHPVKYKILFGTKADAEFQADFKIVKNPDIVINDNEIKSRVISAINEFFALDNWDFGETFYFTELTAYVMQQLAPNIVTFVIVPKQIDQTFGSLLLLFALHNTAIQEVTRNGLIVGFILACLLALRHSAGRLGLRV